MHDEPEKKKRGLRLVSRKSTRKMLGKWRKLSSDECAEDLNANCGNMDLSPRRVLGLPLADAVACDPSLDGVALPAFFRHAIDYIEEHGLSTEGIYRLSPPKSRLDDLERRANSGEVLVFVDGHDAAGLIKRFLRQIPEPLVPAHFETIAESCRCGLTTAFQLGGGVACKCGAVLRLREGLEMLEPERRLLFTYVFLHAQHVMVKENENKMGLQALGLLLQTVLEMSKKLVCFCSHSIRPFDGIEVEGAAYLVDDSFRIIRYVPPMTSDQVVRWLEDGDDGLKVDQIREEFNKQQFLLDLLHSKISERHQKGIETIALDEQVWQVQNAITAIKRKLKTFIDSTPPPIISVCHVEAARFEIFEEKQLMAVQGMLKEDIAEEHRKIAWLLWKLETVGDRDGAEQMTDEDENEEECKLEEAARSALVEEIGKLRCSCAGLRARIEIESAKE